MPPTPKLNHTKPTKKPAGQSRAALEYRLERGAERRAQAAAQLAAERAQVDTLRVQQTRDVVMLRAGQHALDAERAGQLAEAIEAARRRHVEQGRPFDVYGAIRTELEGMGAVAPVGRGQAAAALPPPRSEGRVAVGGGVQLDADARKRELKAAVAAERAKQDADRDRRDRDAYRARLRALGLLDPMTGSYPTGGGLGQ